ncbi:imelysin family protein [Aurantimonas sp. HBX-1]|uniref:imelysin family protein n=1 Tax=Aurantimonas sp. HBX-1 TaxID=2906072 RepID=UPI001F1E0E8F|nr:imelysin family protein [Aurantimonas sp. HBX-1]UIJ72788.1 peptidase M75, Imelysin [Aurantimonas sp. HBX-1]
MKIHLKRLAAIGLALCLAAPAAAQEAAPAVVSADPAASLAVVRNAIDGFIRPGYAAFHQQADATAAAMTTLCEAPGQDSRQAAEARFGDLVQSWSRVELVRFGPVIEDNRVDKILFFPDRRGIALRQIQAILGTQDDTATSAESLAGKSVAVQGLGALEFVLFGTDAETLSTPEGAFRCAYGQAIAENLAAIAASIDAAWADETGITRRLTAPAPGNPAYRSATDSLEEIVGIFVHGLEAVRDLRLRPAIGDSAGDAKPNLFLFRRSGLTLASLRANFDGLHDLFDASKLADLLPAPQAYLETSIDFEFGNAERTLAGLSEPLTDAVASPQRQALTYLLIVTGSLQDLFEAQLSPTLGLSGGFSSLDGD